MKNWQHEPIYWAPSPKLGGGWIAHKDSPSPPAAPDYAGAAQAQGAANVETARLQGQMNNANVYTPYGSQTVTWGTQPKFNEDAYNQALQQYNTQQGVYQQAQAGQKPWGSPESISSLQGMGLQSQFNPATGSSSWYDTKAGGFLDDATAKQRYESSIPGMGAAPVAPTREQFTSQGIADQPNITQTLAPAQQQLLDSQNRISQNLAGVAETGLNRVSQGMQTPFDTSGLPQQQSNVQSGNYQTGVQAGGLQTGLDFSGAPAIPGVNDFGAQRDEVTNALLSRSEPQFQRDEELMRTRLINQGIAPGAEASNYDLDTLNRARNDARMQATLAGSQEQSRLANLAMAARGQYTGEQAQQGAFANSAQNQGFSQGQQNAALNNQSQQQIFQQGLANANLGNQARQTGIQEQAYMRQLPLNELNALRTGAQVQNPQFQPYQGSQIGQTPVFGAAQAQAGANQQAYQQQVGQNNAFNSGLFSLGASAMGAPWAAKLFG